MEFGNNDDTNASLIEDQLLLSVGDFSEKWTTNTLLDSLKNDKCFLYFCYGIFLSRRDLTANKNSLCLTAYSAIGITLISFGFLYLLAIIGTLLFLPALPFRVALFSSMFAIGSIFQFAAGVVAVYYGAIRVASKCLVEDLQYYRLAVRKSLSFILIFLLGAMASGLFSFGLDFPSTLYFIVSYFFIALQTLSSAAAVGVSMMFISVDTKHCLASLDHLVTLANTQLLTTEIIAETRKEMNRILSFGFWTNSVMVVSAHVNTLTFCVCIFCFTSTFNDPGVVLLSIVWYTKEVFYLFIVLFESAIVNEKANHLLTVLGSSFWSNDQELNRVKLYVNLHADPLSFTLLGLRPTRYSVLIQLGSVALAVVVSVVRSIVVATY